MPQRLAKPCRKSGCSSLTRDADGYCDKHKGSAHKQYNKQRHNLAEQAFYRTGKWKLTSSEYRAFHPMCECGCGKPSVMVHHDPGVVELLRLGEDPCDWKFLRALAWKCHELTKSEGK